MSDLLNNSVIEGLWHVLQELLLLNRLHIGALHLKTSCVMPFFLAFNFFTISHLSDPGNRVKNL